MVEDAVIAQAFTELTAVATEMVGDAVVAQAFTELTAVATEIQADMRTQHHALQLRCTSFKRQIKALQKTMQQRHALSQAHMAAAAENHNALQQRIRHLESIVPATTPAPVYQVTGIVIGDDKDSKDRVQALVHKLNGFIQDAFSNECERCRQHTGKIAQPVEPALGGTDVAGLRILAARKHGFISQLTSQYDKCPNCKKMGKKLLTKEGI
jgi:hypothetical protein